MARLQAEEIVLREQVLLPPEPGADPETDPQDEQAPASHQERRCRGPRPPMWSR